MKIKTLLLISLAFAGVWVFYSFFSSQENAEILTATFYLWGFRLKVFQAILVAMAMASVFPAGYFSFKYLQLAKYLRKQKKTRVDDADDESRFQSLSSLLDHGKYEKLIHQLQSWPDSGRTRLLAGKAWFYSHQPDQAVAPLRLAFEENHLVEAGYLLAKAERSIGKSPIPVLKALIATNPENAERAYKLLLEAQAREGFWQDAMETIGRMEKLGLPVDHRQTLGFKYEIANEAISEPPRKRVDRFLHLIKEDPDFVPAYIAAGECYSDLKAPIKMLSLWEQGYAQTGNLVFLDRLEEYYLLQNRPQDAIQVYREILVRDDIPVVRFRLGQLFLKLEMLDDSLKILESLRPQFEEMPGYVSALVECYARMESFREAYHVLYSLLFANPSNKTSFECTGCGALTVHWEARCSQCKGWNLSNSKFRAISTEKLPSAPLYY